MADEPPGTADLDESEPTLLVPVWLARLIYIATAIFLIALLALHTAKWHRIDVDTTSAILLALLILLPLAPYMTKFKAAGVEAEFDRRARRVRQEAPQLAAAEPYGSTSSAQVGRDILTLVQSDPPLALAKLRIELEDVLRSRYDRLVVPDLTPDARGRHRPLSAGQLLDELAAAHAIDRDYVRSLREVLALANKAIHGLKPSRQAAEDIAEVGVGLLELLQTEEELGMRRH